MYREGKSAKNVNYPYTHKSQSQKVLHMRNWLYDLMKVINPTQIKSFKLGWSELVYQFFLSINLCFILKVLFLIID